MLRWSWWLLLGWRLEAPILWVMLFLVQSAFGKEALVHSQILLIVATIVVVSEEAALQTTWALATLTVGPVVVTVVAVVILGHLCTVAMAVARTMEAQRRSTLPP